LEFSAAGDNGCTSLSSGVVGPTGVGKTFQTSVLADTLPAGHSVRYFREPQTCYLELKLAENRRLVPK